MRTQGRKEHVQSPRKLRCVGDHSAETQKQEAWLQGRNRGFRASAGGQSCSCIIFVSSLNKCL